MKDPESTYLQVRLNPTLRKILEDDVTSGRASSLSAALISRAFGQRYKDNIELTCYISIIADLHQKICELVRSQLENKALYEGDILKMLDCLEELKSQACNLVRFYRKGG